MSSPAFAPGEPAGTLWRRIWAVAVIGGLVIAVRRWSLPTVALGVGLDTGLVMGLAGLARVTLGSEPSGHTLRRRLRQVVAAAWVVLGLVALGAAGAVSVPLGLGLLLAAVLTSPWVLPGLRQALDRHA